MPRMQIYLPVAMYKQVKARGLRVSAGRRSSRASEIPRDELRLSLKLAGSEVPQIKRRDRLRFPPLRHGHHDGIYQPEL